MDSLTAHYIARELGERWRERRILACRAEPAARAVTLWCEGTMPVCFDLRALAVRDVSGEPQGSVLVGWSVVDVHAPTDERRIVIQAVRAGKFRGSRARSGTIDVSFVPSARGAQVREARHVLATVGSPVPPPAEPRPVLDDAAVRRAVDDQDATALLRGRWMSGEICDALLAQPERAVERYRLITSLPPASPSKCGDVVFPLSLCDNPRPVTSLILSASRVAAPRLAESGDHSSRAVARMQRELERSREAPRIRAAADALMALGPAAPLPEVISLPDGTQWALPNSLKDSDAIGAAERLYKDARKMERALEELPARIAALETAPRPASLTRTTPKVARPETRRLPYREYRSSGGIDILVGRGARSNDELTYDIAGPNDVWLHARDVTGAHVVMRWTQEGSPPARDLHEAAALAAWHSRARGSAVVPVDWTRRRYVRRARVGPPGRAIVERAKTVMARPSAELERRLRRRS